MPQEQRTAEQLWIDFANLPIEKRKDWIYSLYAQGYEDAGEIAMNAYSVLSYLFYRGYINYAKSGCPSKEEIDEKLKYFSALHSEVTKKG